MYTEYWNLKEKPFELTPDPKFIFYTRDYEEALIRLLYTVKELKGAMLLTGDYGCGKTMLSRVFLNEIMGSQYEVALVTNPRFSANELLAEIIYQLGGGIQRDLSKVQLLRIFNDILYANLMAKKETIVVIDETQAIDHLETYEELRLLLNFQKNDRFLLTLILIGQPELREKLSQLPQLSQRLVINYHLSTLNELTAGQYMDHRLAVAGARSSIFDHEAKKLIYRLTGGVPRMINGIADLALLMGYGARKDMIDEAFIAQIKNDIMITPALAETTH